MRHLSTVRAAALLLLLLLSTSCGGSSEPPETPPAMPDVRYAYSTDPDAPLPEGATTISEEEFARRYAQGKLVLDGPEARREMLAREESQDAEDLATIADHQLANPDAPPMLPELVLVTDGSAEPAGDGNIRLAVGRGEVMTLGERFRLRAVAGSIRQFGTKENQLAIYEEHMASLPAEVIQELGLPPVEAVAGFTAAEIKDLNASVAAMWEGILDLVPDPSVLPFVPPSCDGALGDGDGGDRILAEGVVAPCDFSVRGIMRNHDWPGKEHISCVKNQATRGTCPAFSSVATMEHRVHAKLGIRANLSEQALYARMKLTWGNGQHFKDGYWPNEGFNSSFASGFLVPFENQWNYNPSVGRVVGPSSYSHSCDGYAETCSDSTHQTHQFCTQTRTATYCAYSFPDVNPGNYGYQVASGTINYWDPANRDHSLGLMILAVGLLRQPVVWSFDVAESSFSPDADGFVTWTHITMWTKGGHAVHVVGLIGNTRLAQVLPDAPPGSGGGYFIVKNSWGACWGDAGFAYIPFTSVWGYTLEMVSAPKIL
jgi:hypothetical protein